MLATGPWASGRVFFFHVLSKIFDEALESSEANEEHPEEAFEPGPEIVVCSLLCTKNG